MCLNFVWIIFNKRFLKLKYVGAELSLAKLDMSLLNWQSVEDFVTSLGITFHLQMASGMNDFLGISSLHFGTIYFPHFEYYIVHFLRKLAIVSHR